MTITTRNLAHAAQAMIALGLLVFGFVPVVANADGDFEVRDATAYEVDGVYYIDADIDYILNKTALDALKSGVALTIEMIIEVQRERRWRPDKTIAELLQLYELQYHALSQRYIVRNLNSGTHDTYHTLSAALRDLGYVKALPLLDAALLDPRRNYILRLRTLLDIRSFPGPLRMLAVFFGDWRLTSDWHEWRLVQ